MTYFFYKVLDINKSTEVCFIILITLLIKILLVKKTMTLSSYYTKDFHFVIVGTIKGESKEVALELLKTIMNKSEEIKDISEFHIFGKTL